MFAPIHLPMPGWGPVVPGAVLVGGAVVGALARSLYEGHGPMPGCAT
ncbi:MAG: hypothetical protein QE265_02645 [Rhodoferax sp.]|nr:hypothetical protein [Rhodoferax sp.]